MVFVALYLFPQLITLEAPLPELPMLSAITGGLLLAFGLVARFNMPFTSLYRSSVSMYGAALVTLAIAAVGTDLSAGVIGIFAAAALGSAYFRMPGVLLALGAVNGAALYGYAFGGASSAAIISTVLALNIPVVLGAILLYRDESQHSEATEEDKSYHELAAKLSQVSGKAEVVINAIADGVVALNRNGVIELINPAAQNLIGWGKHDALGLDYKSVLKLVDEKNETPDSATDPIARALASNHQESTEKFNLLTNSGKKLLVSMTVSPVGQNGSGVIIVFRDVTALRAEERQQAEFISTASHEMRTPVASIEGYLGLVLNPATATIDEKARDFISKAHAAAQHLGRLFQDLLDVSKAEDGRLKTDPRLVDVVPFVEDIFQGLAPKAQEKGLRFIFKPSLEDNATRDQKGKLIARNLSPVYYANVDNDHLREVVGNLIENAIKYTPSGEVIVDIGGTEENITISITDTGIGIPKEDQHHLFQKFYRVDNSDTREIGGTGLGLYLCRRLAEAMDGRIWLESEYKKGSTFYLEIPRVSHHEATRMLEDASMRAVISSSPHADPAPLFTSQSHSQQLPNQSHVTPQPAASSQPHTPYQYQEHAAPPHPVAVVPRPNTPLSAIEADPTRYMQSRPRDVSIPRRQGQ